jgi:hypothetical protein
MDRTALHVQRLVMLADGVLIRPFQQAVDLAVGVVEQFDLAHPELVGGAFPGSAGDLVDGLGRKLQVLPLCSLSLLSPLCARSWDDVYT